MPIYAYKCSACGHAQDVLRKMSDPLLTDCPQCGQSTYVKQVTAAGFQLKGSGWYVTDFRNNAAGATGAPATGAATTEGSATGVPAADSSKSASSTSDSAAPSSTPAAAAPTSAGPAAT